MSKDTIHVFNNLNVKGIIANGEIGTVGQILHSNGSVAYWALDDNSGGTITSVATANGLSGGPITTTGTIGVVTGSTLTVNVAGIHVNTANLSIATSQLTGDVALGSNTSGNYVATITNANGISGSSSTEGGAATIGVVTGSTLTVNTTGIHVNSALSITDLALTGNLTVSGTRTYINTTTLEVGDNIVTLNADLGANPPTENAGIEIMRGTSANAQFIWDETNDRWSTNGQPISISSLVAAGAASGITTLAAGNTTITGFANVSTTLQVGTNTSTFGTAAYIVANGNVGIGTSSPAYRLHVVAADGVTGSFFAGASYALRVQSIAATGTVVDAVNNTEATYQPLLIGGSLTRFMVSGLEKMRLDASGNVGIGNTAPGSKLVVAGTVELGNTTITGFASATTEMRAPIFKDSDNTAYYTDPAGTSVLNIADIYGNAYTRGDIYNLDAAGTGWNTVVARNSGSTIVYGGNSVRAPVFYDSDNTAYYTDPAGTSVLNAAIVNGTRTSFELGSLGVSTTVRLLSIEGNYTNGQYAHRFRKEDVGGGVPLSLDFSQGTAGSYTQLVQWGQFSGDGGYYIRHQASTRIAGNLMVKRDANSTNVGDSASIILSNRNTSINGGIMGGIFADTFRDVVDPHYSAGMWFTRVQQVSNLSSSSEIVFGTVNSAESNTIPTERMRINTGGNVGIGIATPLAKLHAVASTATGLGSLPSGATGILDSNGNNYLLFRNTVDNATYSGLAFQDNNMGGYVLFGNAGATPSDQIAIAGYGGGILQYGSSDTINPALRTTVASWNSTGLQINNGDMRAPIFYNTPDTAYYVNPDSTSNLYGLTVNQAITGSVTGYSTYLPTRYDSGVIANPQQYFGQGIGLRVAMTGVPVTWADTLWINGYAGGDVLSMCALHFSRQGTPRMWITTQQSTATSYGTFYEFPSLGYNSGNTSDLYAGIFKDSNNTAYYVDSDSTSRMNAISLDQVNVGDGTFLFKTGAGSGTTRHLNMSTYGGDPSQAHTGQSGITWGYRSDNEPYYMIHLTHGDYSGHTKLSLSWHTGIRIGAGAIYGGTAFYDNSLNAAASPNLIFTVGRGDNNVRSLTTFRAPIMYDIDDGAYYINPASTSNLNGLTVAATITGSITGNAGTATSATSANYVGTTRDTPSDSLQYWQASGLGSTEAPNGDWHNTIRMGHGSPLSYYSSTLAIRMTGAGLGDIYTQNITAGTPQGWKKHWNDGNDGSGSGLDADLLDGKHASDAVGVNTVVTRDGSGYTFLNYINSNTGTNENPTIGQIITINSSNDGYYRKSGIQHVLNSMAGLGTIWTGTQFFLSNRNTTSSSPPLQAYSNDAAQGAIMSFHRSGIYAINMGLDSDNIFRIAGWSAAANAFQMDGSGNLTMLGNVTAYSDVRKKKDITTIENALDMVSRMRGVRFRRIDTDQLGVGVIAQEMLEVLPEVVQQGIGNDDTMSVAYGNIVGVLIEAIKEQQAHINKLETKINSFEQRLI